MTASWPPSSSAAVGGVGERFDQFGFGLGDGFAAAELADVRGADVQHDADLWRGQRGQVADVAEMPGAHLQDEVTGGAFGLQESKRRADLGVERSWRSDDRPELG